MKIKLSLSKKVCCSVGLIFILSLTAIYFLSGVIVQAGFARLESQEAATNLVRLQKSIDSELNHLSSICGDWAPWDDTRDFMIGSNPDYIKSNLTADCIANLELNFMLFLDNSGNLKHISAVDIQEQTEIQLPYELAEYIISNKDLKDLKEPNESKSGFVVLRESVVLVASQPISNSRSEKPIAGILIVGRFLDENRMAVLRENTCLDIKLAGSEIDDSSTPDTWVRIADDNIISGFVKIYDINRNKHITIQVDMPRQTYNYGRKIIFYFMISMTATALITMGGIILAMKTIVLKPLQKLKTNFRFIRNDYNIDTKLYTERQDEIGSLARSFDAMMNHLQQRMLEIAEKQNTTTALNIDLVNTTEKLRQANSELKNFVYVASHDLREPLRKIKVFGELLNKSMHNRLTSDETENLHFMIQGADRMSKMIEALLVYAKISSQAKPFEAVDLNEIVAQLRQVELSVAIEEKNVIIEIPEYLPSIVGDPVQIRQLMQNLIANGIKYQSGNIPHLFITFKQMANNMVRIEVADNGIGIKPEYLSSVFTMFKRLHTEQEYEGTGIGLAVCKKIVEKHHGQIGVESEFGKGSTFWFTVKTADVKTLVTV